MKQIVVRAENKHLSKALQEWCFEQGIFWIGGGRMAFEVDEIMFIFDTADKVVLVAPGDGLQITHSLPKDWNEVTKLILEMISPPAKNWTDQDMKDAITFAIQDDNGAIITEAYCNELFKDFIKDKIKRDEQQASIN